MPKKSITPATPRDDTKKVATAALPPSPQSGAQIARQAAGAVPQMSGGSTVFNAMAVYGD